MPDNLADIVPPVITAQAVKSIMDAWVIPGINRIAKSAKLKSKSLLIPRENQFEDYLLKTYGKLSFLNTLAFKNHQLLLKEVYQPLTLIIESNKDKIQIKGFPCELIEKYKRILITDTAGMGKSTLLKFLFIRALEDKIGVPVFIELRKLTRRHHLLDEIIAQIGGIKEQFDKELILELFQQGNFYFFFDGFDEIPLSNRDSVVEDIKEFITSLPNNYFILTSRPETILSTFGDFRQCEIKPLKENEAFSLLRKYDIDNTISAPLIKELKMAKNASIKEFLKNPLLVSLLFIVYNYKATIPLKKDQFYSQVYDALFESHDLTKGAQLIHEKKCGLDIGDFERILRHIGFQSYRLGRITFSKDEMIKMIGEAKKKWKSFEFTETNFLSDLTLSVPLFSKDGIDYKWAHKSLSEYFAAKYIYLDTKEQQSRILEKIYKSDNLEKFANLLDIYYDLDLAGFRKSFMLPLFKEYAEYLKVLNEESPDYFLRNLLFLKKIKINILDNSTLMSELESIVSRQRQYALIFSKFESGKSILISDAASPNESGKRELLSILNVKNHPGVKSSKPGNYNLDWISENDKNRWIDIETLIESSGMDADRIGELCKLATELDDRSTYYMELPDIEAQIRDIEEEQTLLDLDLDF